MDNQYFLSYSNADAREVALTLADTLAAGPPPIPIWLDKRELQPAADWDEQVAEALRTCEGLLFLMTKDSVHPRSECKREWTRALSYKKPIIPLLFHAGAEMPFRLEPRQYIDFTRNYDAALAKLRDHIRWRSSPEGVLQSLKDRLTDAERDLARADDQNRARIKDEIAELGDSIARQQSVVDDPESVTRETEKRIASGLERERKPAEPVRPDTRTKSINPPPTAAPSWFQDS